MEIFHLIYILTYFKDTCLNMLFKDICSVLCSMIACYDYLLHSYVSYISIF